MLQKGPLHVPLLYPYMFLSVPSNVPFCIPTCYCFVSPTFSFLYLQMFLLYTYMLLFCKPYMFPSVPSNVPFCIPTCYCFVSPTFSLLYLQMFLLYTYMLLFCKPCMFLSVPSDNLYPVVPFVPSHMPLYTLTCTFLTPYMFPFVPLNVPICALVPFCVLL